MIRTFTLAMLVALPAAAQTPPAGPYDAPALRPWEVRIDESGQAGNFPSQRDWTFVCLADNAPVGWRAVVIRDANGNEVATVSCRAGLATMTRAVR